MNYDIDFPVSETWAEFYAAQGLDVDPSLVVGEDWLRDERRIRKKKPDPEAVKELVQANHLAVETKRASEKAPNIRRKYERKRYEQKSEKQKITEKLKRWKFDSI